MATRYRIEVLVDGEWSWKNIRIGTRTTELSVTFADPAEAEREMERLAKLMVGHASSKRLRIVTIEGDAKLRTRLQSTFTLSDEARGRLSRLANNRKMTKTALMESLIMKEPW